MHRGRCRALHDLRRLVVVIGLLFCFSPEAAQGQTITPEFADSYALVDLGPILDLPPSYGGLTLKSGDPNTLLIGGAATSNEGGLYSVGLIRNAQNHITAFTGAAALYAEAPYVDGGVAYGPDDVLFLARWPVDQLGQIRSGSTSVNKVIDLFKWNVESSLAALNFVPNTLAGAGRLKMTTYAGGQWIDATIIADGTGTFDIETIAEVEASRLPGGPEGFAYVPTISDDFPAPSMFVSEYSNGVISAYEVDASGDPLVPTRRVVASGLMGATGAFFDPLTGDYLFATFGGGSRILAIRTTSNSTIIPGDIDGNGFVNSHDAAQFALSFGMTSATWSQGDFDGDGMTTLADFAILQSHLGTSQSPTFAAVPEPSTLGLLATAAAIIIARWSPFDPRKKRLN